MQLFAVMEYELLGRSILASNDSSLKEVLQAVIKVTSFETQ